MTEPDPGAVDDGRAETDARAGTDAHAGSGGDEHARSAAKGLFDLRWLISGLFILYGVLLIVIGIADSAKQVQKADGIRINLWTGLGMLILGVLFGLWSWWRPLRVEALVPPVATKAETTDPEV